jgi:hypothetical protein
VIARSSSPSASAAVARRNAYEKANVEGIVARFGDHVWFGTMIGPGSC